MKKPNARTIASWYPEDKEQVLSDLKGAKILYASKTKNRVVVFDDRRGIYISYLYDKRADDGWFPVQCFLDDIAAAGLNVKITKKKLTPSRKSGKK